MRALSLVILITALGVVGCDNTTPVKTEPDKSGAPSAAPTPGDPTTPGTPGTPGTGTPGGPTPGTAPPGTNP